MKLLSVEKFHNHQASIETYQGAFGDCLSVFYSYNTPVLIRFDKDNCAVIDKKFSTTTTRQLNRYLNEHGMKENEHYTKVTPQGFIELCDKLELRKGVLA